MRYKSFIFTSRWSNHPNGKDTKGWQPHRPPETVVKNGKKIQLWNELEEEFIPEDWTAQTDNDYLEYGNSGIKVNIIFSEISERALDLPNGTYQKEIRFIGLPD